MTVKRLQGRRTLRISNEKLKKLFLKPYLT
jgi:hypothetical protein